MELRWETPPAIFRTGRQSNPDDLKAAKALIENPGEWLRIQDFEGDDQPKAGALAQHIRSGKRAAFRAEHGEFVAVSRKDQKNPGVTAVYVKYTDQVTD